LGGEEVTEERKPEDEPPPSPESASDEAIRRAEEQQFQQAQEELRQAIQSIPEAAELAQSLMVDNTPEGLRIQIVDQEGVAMFPSGGAEPLERAKKILRLVSDVVKRMPQQISISGHTDSVPFGVGSQYTNWELSVDRANAARRFLRDTGLPVSRLSRVVGKADTEHLVADQPENPRNRRLSIVLLRGTGEAAPTQAPAPGSDAAAPQESGNQPGGTPR
jgi:chemotaxis protein MotB